MDKRALRAQVREALKSMPPARRALEEELLQAAVQAEPGWQAARTVLLYRAMAPEPSVVGLTLAAWRSGKAVAFPRVVGQELRLHRVDAWEQMRPGAFGIHEPDATLPGVPPEVVDLAIIPGVAFDGQGGRLGRGGGFYDRLLPKLRCPAWAVAFGVQRLEPVPREAHDHPVTRVFFGDRLSS